MKLFTTTLILALLSFAPVMAGAAGSYDSNLNHPSHWGDSCYKINFANTPSTYTVTDSSAVKVIVKGGTTNKVYEDGPFTDLTAQINPRSGKPYGISHVIICADTIDNNTPNDPDRTDDGGIIDDEAVTDTNEQPQVAGTSTVAAGVKTLPATGAPVVANLVTGTVLSTLAGLIARRRQE